MAASLSVLVSPLAVYIVLCSRPSVLAIAFYPSLVVLALKVWEQFRCILWTLKHGDKFLKKVLADATSRAKSADLRVHLREKEFPFFPGNTPLTAWMRVPWIRTSAVGKVVLAFFKYPVLMFVTSVLAVAVCSEIGTSGREPACLLPGQGFILGLFVALMVENLHLVIYRYQYGALDNVMSGDYVHWVSPETLPLVVARHDSIRRFMLIFGTTYLVTVIAYGAIYYGISAGVLPGNTLTSSNGLPLTVLDGMYFSTVTLSTVGYGDILPAGPLSKLFVMSEIGTSYLLLVLLFTAFASSMYAEEK